MSHNLYQTHSSYPSSSLSMPLPFPISQAMSPTPNSLGPNQPSGSPPTNLTSVNNVQDISHHSYKTETDNMEPHSPQHMYSSNLPPASSSMVSIMGPHSGKFSTGITFSV